MVDGEMRMLGTREAQRELTPAAAVRLERPPKQIVGCEKLVPDCLAIARPGPELLATSDSPQGPFEEAREDHPERGVEPDHGVRPRPDQLAGAAPAVIPIDDPSVTFDGARDALLEKFLRDERPLRTPCERVELDERYAEPTR